MKSAHTNNHQTETEPSRHGFNPALALSALVLVCLASVAWVRLSGQEIHAQDEAPMVMRALRFEDTADGSIAVIDANSSEQIQTIKGEQGFMRGALRALARERKKRGLGAEQPFELIARKDGRLTLHDPATGVRIDLESFGPTNAGVFARLLITPGTASTTGTQGTPALSKGS